MDPAVSSELNIDQRSVLEDNLLRTSDGVSVPSKQRPFRASTVKPSSQVAALDVPR